MLTVDLCKVSPDGGELQTWRLCKPHIIKPSSPGMFTFRTNQRPPTGLTPWMNTAHPFRQECVWRRHAPSNRRANSGPVTNQLREGAGTFNRKRCWISVRCVFSSRYL